MSHHLRRVEAVICNLAHAALFPPPTGRIAVKLGRRASIDELFERSLEPAGVEQAYGLQGTG
jgi:hypothetical protein